MPAFRVIFSQFLFFPLRCPLIFHYCCALIGVLLLEVTKEMQWKGSMLLDNAGGVNVTLGKEEIDFYIHLNCVMNNSSYRHCHPHIAFTSVCLNDEEFAP